jgi:hypothetical protein
MVNQIIYLKNPPNDPSPSEYSLWRLFNFHRWLFNAAVTGSKNPCSQFSIRQEISESPIRSVLRLHPLCQAPKLAESLRPFSAAPEQLMASRSKNGAQEIQREEWEGERIAAAISGVDLQL